MFPNEVIWSSDGSLNHFTAAKKSNSNLVVLPDPECNQETWPWSSLPSLRNTSLWMLDVQRPLDPDFLSAWSGPVSLAPWNLNSWKRSERHSPTQLGPRKYARWSELISPWQRSEKFPWPVWNCCPWFYLKTGRNLIVFIKQCIFPKNAQAYQDSPNPVVFNR